MSSFLAYASVTALMFTGLLLIFIVLLQRGRGGGLAGALGGAGGQSALGTKAGDNFTKITIGLAAIWILLACLSIYSLRWNVDRQAGAFADDTNADAAALGDAPPIEDAVENEPADTASTDAAVDTPSETESAPANEEAADAAGSAQGPSLIPPEAEPATPATEGSASEQ